MGGDSPVYGRWQWIVIVPVVFLQFVGGTLTVAILPGLQNGFFGGHTFTVLGMAQGLQGILMFLCSPTLGALSDWMGRKPLFLATQVAMALPQLALVLTPDLWWYTAVGVGTGALAAYYYLSFAFISDVTGPDMRRWAMGVTSSMLGVSLLIGPPLGDLILHKLGQQAVFITSLAVACTNVLYIGAFVPETVPRNRSSRLSTEAGAAPLIVRPTSDEYESAEEGGMHGLKRVASTNVDSRAGAADELPWSSRLNPVTQLRVLFSTRVSRMVAFIVFMSNLSEQALLTLVLPYLQHHFSFTPALLTWFAITTGGANFLAQALLMGPGVRCLGARRFLQVALVFSTIHVTIYGIAWEGWMTFVAAALAPGAYVIAPTSAYVLSLTTSPDEMGAMQGALVGVKNLGNGVGPSVFGALLHLTVFNPSIPPYLRGAAFFLGSLCTLAALVTACLLPRELDEAERDQRRADAAKVRERRRSGASTHVRKSGPLP